MDNDEQPAIVIDNGSATCKAGLAGEDGPSVVFPSIIGYPRNATKNDAKNVVLGFRKEESTDNTEAYYVGNEAIARRTTLTLRYPVEHGLVTNWDDMEKVWHYTYYAKLRVNPEEHRVILTEPQLFPKAYRERMIQIMFETFGVPAYYVAIQPVLSLYASGRTTGVVLSSGAGITVCSPIYEGYSLPHAFARMDVSGRDLTEYLMKMLTERGYALTSTAARDVVRGMKEKICYVAMDYEKEVEKDPEDIKQVFEVHDGSGFVLDQERFRCPEVLFQPSLIGKNVKGVHTILYESIMKCEIDIQGDLLRNIVLAGGNTMFEGFQDRLLKEVSLQANANMKVEIVGNTDRLNSTWIGAALLGSLTTFSSMWITNAEYEENGPGIVHRKCF